MSSLDTEIAFARDLLDDVVDIHAAGKSAATEPRYRAVAPYGYRVPESLPNPLDILARPAAFDEATEQWNSLVAVSIGDPLALHEKGLRLSQAGRLDEATACLESACRLDPENPIAANNLAVMLSNAGRKREALIEFERALALQPENIRIRHQIKRLIADQVPFWHIPMMNDVRRNDAFEAAIKAALDKIGPSAKVLDIGTGSGLLSMMAARAGAQSVVACEAVPIIADMAQKIVAKNGYGDRIRIFAKPSTELEVGEELDTRADILVSEILSSDLLTENVLDTFEDAHARLLKENATIIPRAASAIGCLVESDILADYVFVDEVSGFDLSSFTAFAAQKLPIHGTMTNWQRLSNDIELLRIDLTAKRHENDLHIVSVPIQKDGVATGIVQWMHIDLAEGVSFDNHPNDYTDGGWLQVLHNFAKPIKVRAGESLDLAVGHDRVSLIVQPLAVAGGDAAITGQSIHINSGNYRPG